MLFSYYNILSMIRGPLAFFFLFDNVLCRTLAIFFAMVTDVLDGYLARRYNAVSQTGAIIDPLMDKFFVFFVAGVLYHEGLIQVWEGLALISRDFAVFFFSLYVALRGKWSNFQVRSIWTGKLTTTLQFFVFFSIVFHFQIPAFVYTIFIILGVLALIELYAERDSKIGFAKKNDSD